MPTLIGGKYEVIAKLGQGGMGTVYKVRHTTLESVYALKMLPDHLADNPELVGRFQREARTMAQMRHDNIVRVFALEHDRDLYYLIMDFIDGPTLAQYLRTRGRLPPADALDIARQVARALSYAHTHGRGVVHRDVKPSNVLLELSAPPHALLADFGIAKVDDAGERTQTGSLLGSLKYSAPEQLGYKRGKERVPIDARADVFALGLVIYEMCEGRQFHADLESHEIIGRMVYDPAPFVPEFSHPVPSAVEALVARAIHRDPEGRYATMAEMLRDIDRCVSAPAAPDDSPTVAMVIPRELSPDDVSDDELDQRIRSLEVERQRRLVQGARARVDAARERAQAARAADLASTPYESATTQQQQAAAALEQSQYLKARDLLEEAARLFSEAAAEAEARQAIGAAEAARTTMQAAKAEADAAEAAEAARTLYARALALESEAEAHWTRNAYRDAELAYREASDGFGEAVARALAVQKGVAEQARAGMEEARGRAEAAGADDLVPTLFRRGAQQAKEAASAEQRSDYERAGELLDEATRIFTEAAVTGLARHAEDARRAMSAAKQDAEQAGAAVAAQELYARASACEGEAGERLAAKAHEEARRTYEEARALYGDACTRARQVQREATERARAELLRARAGAEAAGATDLADTLFKRAAAEEHEATSALERDEYGRARELLEDATRLFTKASAEAEAARLAERVARTRDAMLEARRSAERGGADEGSTLHGRAVALETEADQHLARRAFAEAERCYSQALGLWNEAAKRAGDAQRTAAEHARAEMQAARNAATAAGAERGAAALFREARGNENRAGSLFVQGDFTGAAERFAAVAREYERAAEEARAAREAGARAAEAARAVREEGLRAAEAARTRRDEETRAARQETTSAGGPGPDVTRVDSSARARMPAPVADDATDVTRHIDQTVAQGPTPQHPVREQRAVAATLKEPPANRRLPLVALMAGLALVAAGGIAYMTWWRPGTGPAPEAVRVTSSPLAWSRVSPGEPEQIVKEGETLRFSADIRDAERRSNVRYVWLLDGAERAQGNDWSYTTVTQDAGQAREVKVVASVGQEKIEQTWWVRVKGANRAPVIVSASPEGDTVTLADPKELEFSVEVNDLDPGDQLTYAWDRNGNRVAEGGGATWTLRDPADGDDVRVTVADSAGLSGGSRAWRITLAKPPVTVNASPRVVGQSPAGGKIVSVPEGGSADFSLRAEDPDRGDRIDYTWFLDGREVGRSGAWQFKAPESVSGKAKHRVDVEVADQGGLKAPRVGWNLEVTSVPPRIFDFEPSAREVVVDVGQVQEFRATAGGTVAGQIEYDWRVDGASSGRTRVGQFQLPTGLGPGAHAVEVAAIDARGARSQSHRWAVQVRKSADEVSKVVPPPGNGVEQITEKDVRDWLARYKRAWEARDVDSLKALGVVSGKQADALRTALSAYKGFKVSITNENILLGGSEAALSFDRTDTDEAGKSLSHPRETFRLRRGSQGVLAIAQGDRAG